MAAAVIPGHRERQFDLSSARLFAAMLPVDEPKGPDYEPGPGSFGEAAPEEDCDDFLRNCGLDDLLHGSPRESLGSHRLEIDLNGTDDEGLLVSLPSTPGGSPSPPDLSPLPGSAFPLRRESFDFNAEQTRKVAPDNPFQVRRASFEEARPGQGQHQRQQLQHPKGQHERPNQRQQGQQGQPQQQLQPLKEAQHQPSYQMKQQRFGGPPQGQRGLGAELAFPLMPPGGSPARSASSQDRHLAPQQHPNGTHGSAWAPFQRCPSQRSNASSTAEPSPARAPDRLSGVHPGSESSPASWLGLPRHCLSPSPSCSSSGAHSPASSAGHGSVGPTWGGAHLQRSITPQKQYLSSLVPVAPPTARPPSAQEGGRRGGPAVATPLYSAGTPMLCPTPLFGPGGPGRRATGVGRGTQGTQEGAEEEADGVKGVCVNFDDAESECQDRELDKDRIEGVCIVPLPLASSSADAAELVLYALYFSSSGERPFLPGSTSTRRLFPRSLQAAARA